jgi:hypothetical protein
MNTFKKVAGAWCVQSFTGTTGDTVTVSKRNGQTSQVLLGRRVAPTIFAVGTPAAAEAPAAQVVGDLSGIIAMFDRARTHLRFPAVVLDGFRVNVAGDRAREPGSLTITSPDRSGDGRRRWLGRVTLSGQYEPARDADPAIGERLRAFAADPAGVAAAYGRLHGACCFCRRALRDERSTAVGYGPDCADHFGLPWGARAAAEAVTLQPLAVRAALSPVAARSRDPMLQPIEGEPFAA